MGGRLTGRGSFAILMNKITINEARKGKDNLVVKSVGLESRLVSVSMLLTLSSGK